MKKSLLTTKASFRRTSRNKIIVRTVLVGVVMILLVFFVPKALSYVANILLTPIYATESWLLHSKSSLPYFFRDRKELVDEIMELKSRPPEGVGDHLAVNRLTKENKELRSLMSDTGDERILAGVIGRPNVFPYDVLVIDHGSVDGIVEGAPVYIGNDTVIGVVKEVAKYSSVVEMITTPSFETTVYIYGPDIYTTAVGMGGGVLRVGVPQGIDLNKGDLVVLPSLEAGIFGEISAIDSLPTQPEQYGFVTPEIPVSSLRLVTVGKDSIAPTTFEEAHESVEKTYRDLFVVPVPEDILIDTNASASTSGATSTEQTDGTIIQENT